jgi:DNA-binding LytR/AlgR family response regulator
MRPSSTPWKSHETRKRDPDRRDRAFIEGRNAPQDKVAALTQTLNAAPWQGKLVRLTMMTKARLKAKLSQRPADLSGLQGDKPAEQLRWIQASAGGQLRFVDVNDVRCFRADAKYTRVVTAGLEGHIRTTIKDLAVMLMRGASGRSRAAPS